MGPGILLWPLALLSSLGLIDKSGPGIRPSPLGWVVIAGAVAGGVYLVRKRR